ncbi:ABC transporter permease subunit, partial [Pusillimonas noertemannii]|uniref:ABC transporter permease subunit n=1 Tax=Pusillimonas noertemannii TaxID=305977 RepID=UPI00334057A7
MKSRTVSNSQRGPARPAAGPRWRPILYQALLLGAVGLLAWFLVANTLANLQARNISTGFGFLHDEAGFAIGESMLAFSPTDSYGRALLIGVLNTLRVAAIGIVAATLLGVFLGIARLSRNWLVSGAAGAYIETMRNIPLLLHLFFWYALIT